MSLPLSQRTQNERWLGRSTRHRTRFDGGAAGSDIPGLLFRDKKRKAAGESSLVQTQASTDGTAKMWTPRGGGRPPPHLPPGLVPSGCTLRVRLRARLSGAARCRWAPALPRAVCGCANSLQNPRRRPLRGSAASASVGTPTPVALEDADGGEALARISQS